MSVPDRLEEFLRKLKSANDRVARIDSAGVVEIRPQSSRKNNIALIGRGGKLWVTVRETTYDVSLVGRPERNSLYEPMCRIHKRAHDDFTQRNATKGTNDNPMWRLQTHEEVERSIELIAGVDFVGADTNTLPEEVDTAGEIYEGAAVTISINAFERSRVARRKCIEHFGCRCAACDLRFEEVYGAIGADFIHVHHVVPISEIGENYRVDPVRDLIPVCPNCHAMLHRSKPPLLVDELRRRLAEGR